MKNPIQPLAKDNRGTLRFKDNEIVQRLYEVALKNGCGLNELAAMEFSQDDRQQFAQLLGYSLNGYGELGYVDNDSYETAKRMFTEQQSEEQTRIEHLEAEIKGLRDSLREPMAHLFGVHPDDLA